MAYSNSVNTINEELSDNYIYISHLDEAPEKFWYLPVYPDNVSDSLSSRFTEQNALGRTAPVVTYSNSGPRTVKIDLTLHRDLFDEVNEGRGKVKRDPGEDYADSFIKAMQSIALPKYNLTNKLIEPPLVALRLGNEIFIKGIVNGGISVTYSKPILSNNKYAQVSLSLTITEVDPYDSTYVFKNGSFRLITKTLKRNWNTYE